jgi:uncharacterized membrane protein YccC
MRAGELFTGVSLARAPAAAFTAPDGDTRTSVFHTAGLIWAGWVSCVRPPGARATMARPLSPVNTGYTPTQPNQPMSTRLPTRGPIRAGLRLALSQYATIGLSAALGLFLISAAVDLLLGPFAAAAATVGVIVVVPPDQPAPRRGKFWQLLPAAVIGPPLFFVIQTLHARPLELTSLLVSATFLAFLGAAWGKRGLPISVSVMFAMIFSMAVPAANGRDAALSTTLHFALGAGLYLVYGTLANALLNDRYRRQTMADTLFSVAALMRTQARQFTIGAAAEANGPTPLIGRLMVQQATLADQLQTARNILLESPGTPRRQQLAAMLMQALEMRDHLLACELDLDTVQAHPDQSSVLEALRHEVQDLAIRVESLADSLLLGRKPDTFPGARHLPDAAELQQVIAEQGEASATHVLARGLISRVGHIHDEVRRLVALARGDLAPDLAVVRTTWQLFISPTGWSWKPLTSLWRWDAPPLRHAIRAALAIGTGQIIALWLPWGPHDYWILLTIVVVLRGSLAQTLERRNSRVFGTLLGCLLAGAMLYAHTPSWVLLVAVTLAQGVAHAFAIKRYLVTAVAATVLALVQAHLLNAAASPVFEVAERIADTLIGAAIAWVFSYVLPSWERTQLPALVRRTLAAQARHAQLALGLGQLSAVDNKAEVEWRLARREVYDSLSALVQATQRSLFEPRAVRPPLAALERMLVRSYQLLAQLTAVKTMLLQRRDRLNIHEIQSSLQGAALSIESTLSAGPMPPDKADDRAQTSGPVALPDPFEHDLNPWLLRRLQLATAISRQLRRDAHNVA